jgi:hypothetical protein
LRLTFLRKHLPGLASQHQLVEIGFRDRILACGVQIQECRFNTFEDLHILTVAFQGIGSVPIPQGITHT